MGLGAGEALEHRSRSTPFPISRLFAPNGLEIFSSPRAVDAQPGGGERHQSLATDPIAAFNADSVRRTGLEAVDRVIQLDELSPCSLQQRGDLLSFVRDCVTLRIVFVVGRDVLGCRHDLGEDLCERLNLLLGSPALVVEQLAMPGVEHARTTDWGGLPAVIEFRLPDVGLGRVGVGWVACFVHVAPYLIAHA